MPLDNSQHFRLYFGNAEKDGIMHRNDVVSNNANPDKVYKLMQGH